MEKQLNHFDKKGKARMVYVEDEPESKRVAEASGRINMQPGTFPVIMQETKDMGDVLGVARLAGIRAVKKTAEIIPLSHNIHISACNLDFFPEQNKHSIKAVCRVTTFSKSGAEMEALTGVSAALLTIYDLGKAMDHGMEITGIRIEEQTVNSNSSSHGKN